MSKTVTYYFFTISPYAFLGHQRLLQIAGVGSQPIMS